jgi:hypothetical protein
VADGHGRVLADEQERRRHADDRRPADDDRAPAFDLDPAPSQDLDRGVGRRREEPVVAKPQQAGVQRVDPVDVLRRVDRVDDGSEPDRRRQRHLDDDPVDERVRVEGCDDLGHAALRRLALDLDEPPTDADQVAALEDLLEVDRRRRLATDDHDREAGRVPDPTPVGLDVLRDRLADLGGDRAAEEQARVPSRHGHLVIRLPARGRRR